VDGFAVHASIATGSVIVPDDLAASDHRVGGAHGTNAHHPVVEPTTLQVANRGEIGLD
jgi:hypothetical protein